MQNPPPAEQAQKNKPKKETKSLDATEITYARTVAARLGEYCSQRIVGQDDLRQTLLLALLSNGHVLLESVPGLAKTTAAKTLAEAIAAKFSRVQCTPDLLPSDIVGTQIYNENEKRFETVLGPAFANFVLLDEVNRSSAKTQSAMLELMQERQATIGGVTHNVPDDLFMVIATQNPIEQEGTYPLSEAQMDRFLFKETLMYPSAEEEKEILDRLESGIFDHSKKVVSLDFVRKAQAITARVYAADEIKSYIAALVDATRLSGQYVPKGDKYVKMGASPRASIALLSAAKATAIMNERGYVIPEDVKKNRYRVFRHRIAMNYAAKVDNVSVEQIIDAIFEGVPTP